MNTTNRSPDRAYRKTAVVVGILYIIGTIAGILSAFFTGPIFNDSDFLIKVSANQTQVIIGALCVLMMGFSLAMVPVMLFPIFRKQNEALALGAVLFRGALEAVTYMAMGIIWLILIIVSQAYSIAGAPEAANFQVLGTLLLDANGPINTILEIVFSLGALMIYALFYQSKLIPLWLSGWGLIGALLYLAAGLLEMFGLDVGFLLAPLALQEMVLALWLIIKGFNPYAVDTETA